MLSTAILGFVGWTFVPSFVTQHALKIVIQYYPRIFGRPSPAPGTQLYVQLYRYTYASVVLAYLCYNLINGSSNMAPNFYQVLGVAPDVDENGLKLAFRQFAKRYHPDRVGIAGAELFMQTRDAFEALKNPTIRFAYDRFGPDVLQWTQLSTPREYVRHGLLQSAGYHIVTAVGLLVFSALGNQSPVKFWRYILFLVFFTLELAYVLYPSPTSLSIFEPAFWDPTNNGNQTTVLHLLFPQRVAYQHILFLHQMFIFLSIALTRVAPQLFPDDEQREQRMILQQITSVILHTDLHSIHPSSPTSRVSISQMRPVLEPSSEIIDLLAEELKNMIIESKVKQDSGPLRSAWEAAVLRGRSRSESSARAPNIVIPVGKGREGDHLSPPSACEGEGKLPSPRPSPPPSVQRNSSYARARSVSWS
ncbi:hypothetical protein D9757_006164 [Collybiopsis confluens]|uniref:J domain-containing protein n=1 Tax=Collybiopsis confluens TaxID=2823264 RepID=A0A8H5M7A8_9AGAR|nr:hypothetical protein D9757_006164 [Collybiopsis confluens]